MPSPPPRRPPRVIEYGELPPTAVFLEVAPGQYQMARTFAETGEGAKSLGERLGVTARYVSSELHKLCVLTGRAGLHELLVGLRSFEIVLVEVHHRHRRTNWLTRPATDRTAS